MKKLLKVMAAVFVMVMMCGAVVSADEATITPDVISTGAETPTVYNCTYNLSTTVAFGNASHYGKVYPINVAAGQRLFISFDSQSLNAPVYICLATDKSLSKGDWLAENVTYLSSYSHSKSYIIDTTGTYYLYIFTSKDNASRLSQNNVSFKVYSLNNSYYILDVALTPGHWVVHPGDNQERCYQFTLPSNGHVTIESNTGSNVYYDILNSSKSVVKSSKTFNSSNRTATYYLNAGTYYIKTKGSSYNYMTGWKATVYGKKDSAYYVKKTNQNVTVNSSDYSEYVYIKYKAPKTGVVVLTAKAGSGYITLLKSNRESAYSTEQSYDVSGTSNKKVSYGVKKGITYYFKVKCYSPTTFNIKTTAVKESSGSKQSKAKTISKKRYKNGTILAGNKTVDWYKFKLSKKSKVRFTFTGNTNDTIKFSIYQKRNGKLRLISYSLYGRGTGFKLTPQSDGKWSKGTYWIKVERGNTYSSGNYKIKWY